MTAWVPNLRLTGWMAHYLLGHDFTHCLDKIYCIILLDIFYPQEFEGK